MSRTSPSGIAASLAMVSRRSLADSLPLKTMRCFTSSRNPSARMSKCSFRSVRSTGDLPFLERLPYVGKNKSVSLLVVNESSRIFLNRSIRIFHGKVSCSADQLVLELRSGFLALRMHRIPDRSALHMDDRLMPVAPIRRCRQTDNISRFDLVQDTLKGNSRQMMAFIHDHLTITGDHITDFILSDKALDHGNIQYSVRLVLPCPILPISFGSMPRNKESLAIH